VAPLRSPLTAKVEDVKTRFIPVPESMHVGVLAGPYSLNVIVPPAFEPSGCLAVPVRVAWSVIADPRLCAVPLVEFEALVAMAGVTGATRLCSPASRHDPPDAPLFASAA